jgi:hypothetical protein
MRTGWLGWLSRQRRALLLVLIGLVVIWLVGAGIVLIFGLLDASHGMSEVQKAKSRLSASDLVSHAALTPLRAARSDFSSSEGLLHSPFLVPFEILPVIGRQLKSVQDLSTAAKRTTQIGVSAIDQVRAVLDVTHEGGPDRVATLRRLAVLATTTDGELKRIDAGPAEALFSPLAHKRANFVRQLEEVRTRLAHAAAVAETTANILQGPKTYLVLMANPAEMRAGSGDFLEAGVMTTNGGQVQLTGIVPTATLALAPGTVPVGGDLEARWGWAMPSVDWRNLGLTPQFDVNGPLAARMWAAATGEHVDGVMAVDVEALRQILTVTGPVTLQDGKVVSANDVMPFLLHDQYAGLTDIPVASGAAAQAQQARQEALGSLAHSALSALENESLDLKSLADAMSASTGGRHILLWSKDPASEAAWTESGVAGRLSPSSLLVSVMNGGGNKLDQYLDVEVSLRLASNGRDKIATLTVNLHNHTPPGQSQFIVGPYPGLDTAYGEYVGLLALNLPADSSHVQVEGRPPLVAQGAEGPTWLVATPVDVREGESEQVVVHFDLPSSLGSVTVLPSARPSPVPWTYTGGRATDATPFVISW